MHSIWLILPIFYYFLVNFANSLNSDGLQRPKLFRIDLDAPSRERWHHVLDEYKNDVIPSIAQMARSYVPNHLQKPVFGIFEKLAHFLPHEYAEELRGMADYLADTGVTLGELVAMNMLYDLTDFAHGPFMASPKISTASTSEQLDRSQLPPPLGCTSIVAAGDNGRILHGRNLDYGMTELLKNATILVDFVRGGKVQFTSISFVTYVGVLTGQKPDQFTVSLNSRYSGGPVENFLMAILTRFHHPAIFELRKVLENADDYVGALVQLSQVPMIAPSYIILGGKAGDGAIITRDRLGAADIYYLDYLHHRWFLLETNFDHWKPSCDKRRRYGRKYMKQMGQHNLAPNALFQRVMARQPIRNNETVYSTIMSAEEPEFIYNYTIIW